MDKPKRYGCRKCEQIAREINEALATMVRAATGEEAKLARRRAARALEDKREHELRTGHSVTT